MKFFKKKFIPYGRQNISNEDISIVSSVLKKDLITQGPLVKDFENKVCKKVSAKYSIAVNSATSALHLACLSIGLKKDDWLWTSPTSFVASANCGLYCGAKIDFVDINLDTGLIDLNCLERKLEDAKKNKTLPKIFIPVHLAGTCCDMERIYELSKIYNFYIIEDASHAIGGRYNSNFIGSCKYSNITVFSFHPVKIITTAEGGMATTNDKDLARKMNLLKSHGITKNIDDFIGKDKSPWIYEQQILGFNYRMNEIQAALGLSQLKRLGTIVRKRNKLLRNYQNMMNDLPLSFLKIPENVKSSVHLCVILFKNFSKLEHIEIFKYLQANGIGVQIHYIPIYNQPFYRRMGFKRGYCPNAETYASSAISIPLFPGLSEDEQIYIVEKITKFIKYKK